MSGPVESLATKNQLSDEALENSNEEILPKEAAESIMAESKSKYSTLVSIEDTSMGVTESEGSFTEETFSSISGCQEIIDEHTLDLWIQTALSGDTDETQEGPENGQQAEPSNEDQGEISSMQQEESKEQLVDLVSDLEMSSSTVESGFSDQSLGEVGTQSSETQLLKSTSAESFQGICDKLENVSESVESVEPSNEDQGEISSMQQEESKEQLVDLVSDLEMSSSTVESGFSDQSLGEVGTQSSETQLLKSTSAESFQGICDKLENVSESVDISEFTSQHSKSLMRETSVTDLKQEELVTATGFQPDSGVTSPEATDLNQESDKSQEEADKERVEPVELETGSQIEISDEVVDQAMTTDRKDTEEANIKSEITGTEDEPLEMSYSPDELKHTESGRSRSSSEALLEEEVELTESGSQGESCTESERKLLKLPSLDKPQPRWSEDVTGSLAAAEEAEQQATKSDEQMEVDAFVLDFTVQRSRIAIKNPRVRPPKDPRSLLHMPSLDPTPSSPLPVKAPVGMPLGGLGIGIKLPGLGAGFPVLKKTQRVVRDENSPETLSEETKAEEKSDTPKQEEAQRKPKWMPPRHPGFGNPLMSELKTKLKKTNE
ncbi:uncharacterized protein si:ch211-136m16.8 [Plectropomus leopardus]|uniref:uncharacterized protein si:ch211-136m16.8 n=1 Tax=Plectropomus leopardus TaxID=160734 RepID=UPI001C4D0EF9|nr:uncharacterized protein si:ch211-136m16.8 [Plectropomus leopardus]